MQNDEINARIMLKLPQRQYFARVLGFRVYFEITYKLMTSLCQGYTDIAQIQNRKM